MGTQANPSWQLAIDNWKSGIVLVRFESLGCSVRRIRRFNLMAEEPAHVGQGALGVAADRNQLGGNGHGDLLRRNRAHVQTNGRMDALEELRRDAFFSQLT